MNDYTAYRRQIVADLFGTAPHSLGAYFNVYDGLLARGDIRVLQVEDPMSIGLDSLKHNDILRGAQILREAPTLTLNQAVDQLKTSLTGSHSTKQLKFALIVSIRLMLMLDCAAGCRKWDGDQSYLDFVGSCLPKTYGASDRIAQALVDKKSMKAWKLKARSGIIIEGTDDISRHLHLDREGPTLYIFHHTTFLNAQLSSMQEHDLGIDYMSYNLRRGCLPPRLINETLHSIKEILFHFDDQRSSNILERLITKGRFDKDCAQPRHNSALENPQYAYWGERLATLHEFTMKRPPRSKFERWIKWQTSDSNAFAVALAALLVTVIVSVLTLALASFQAWIAWKAWKEPLSGVPDIVLSVEHYLDWVRQYER